MRLLDWVDVGRHVHQPQPDLNQLRTTPRWLRILIRRSDRHGRRDHGSAKPQEHHRVVWCGGNQNEPPEPVMLVLFEIQIFSSSEPTNDHCMRVCTPE
jgi:hypothetical protein